MIFLSMLEQTHPDYWYTFKDNMDACKWGRNQIKDSAAESLPEIF
jgi:hypothetical protein